MSDKGEDTRLIAKVRADHKAALVSIGYSLDPDFRENVGCPEMQAAIAKSITKCRGELPQRTSELAAAQQEIQDQQDLLTFVSQSLCDIMRLEYSPTKSLRTVMTSVTEQATEMRLDRSRATRDLSEVERRIRSLAMPLGIPEAKDFYELLTNVVSETAAQCARYHELLGLAERMRGCLRGAADTLCTIGGDFPLAADANDNAIISLVQKAIPNLDNFIRVDKLNHLLGQRGSPMNYLPLYTAEFAKFRRAVETIGKFDEIVQAMFDDFVASKNSAFTDLQKFAERFRKEFGSLSPTIEATTLSFLSKVISFIEAMAKVILQDHLLPEVPAETED
jgi:hypothetical protein